MTSDYFYERFDAYRQAIDILKMNGTLVSERKAAIHIINEFETDLRDGKFDKLLKYMFGYSNMVQVENSNES